MEEGRQVQAGTFLINKNKPWTTKAALSHVPLIVEGDRPGTLDTKHFGQTAHNSPDSVSVAHLRKVVRNAGCNRERAAPVMDISCTF